MPVGFRSALLRIATEEIHARTPVIIFTAHTEQCLGLPNENEVVALRRCVTGRARLQCGYQTRAAQTLVLVGRCRQCSYGEASA